MKNTAWIVALGTGMSLCGALGACSGTTDTDGTGGSGASTTTTTGAGGSEPATPTSYCEGKLARETTCDGAASQTQAECEVSASTTCLFDIVREEVLAALVDCLNARACGVGDDQCWYDAGANDPTPGQEAYITACLDKYNACPGSFAQDYCAATVATTEMYATFDACLDLACGEVKACLDAAVPVSCQ